MRRRLVAPLVAVLVVAFGLLAATLAVGNSPELGLDLQGGASVVLRPPGDIDDDVLDQAIEVIRNRIDALGVAEPQIARQGGAVVVELPGVADPDRALEIVGQTAELRFRPVLGQLPPEGVTPEEPATTTTVAPTDGTSTTVAPDASTTTTTVAPAEVPTTPREEDVPEAEVVLPADEVDGEVPLRYRLGPAQVTGDAVETASARFLNPGWAVDITFTGDGIGAFNELAADCYATSETCPPSGSDSQTGQLRGSVAIALDGVVESAPVIQAPEYDRDEVVISGDFSEGEAKDLALVLRYGSLPVQLEQETVSTVSPSLGRDSLRAGLVAGAIGTAAVLLYLIVYYKALGLVVVAGLCVWAALQWSIISYLGATQGLALSLAGATGIIVSVGVTVDSYIVYFERLKDEVRAGRTIRSSVERGFKAAFRTILAADVSAFIGAALLYLLTVGPVRGFAFFLGLSTLLDLVVAYFFTRPVVALLARRQSFTSGRFMGVGSSAGGPVRERATIGTPV